MGKIGSKCYGRGLVLAANRVNQGTHLKHFEFSHRILTGNAELIVKYKTITRQIRVRSVYTMVLYEEQ